MNPILIGLLSVLTSAIIILIFLIIQIKKKSETPQDNESLKVMMEWMKDIKQGTEQTRDTMEKNLSETNRAINDRLDNAGRVIAGLSKELGSMSQVGPDIRRLAETLSSSKLRGNFGEEMLENMLSQVLPVGNYNMQYRFKNGEIVDAIVKIGSSILPIDSKFSLENYRLFKEAGDDKLATDYQKAFFKDIKKRIEEIHKKYILPQENTFDFALMYMPSQGVYEEAIINSEIMDFSKNKRVIPVGPNSLYTYLQSIVLSLRGQEINKVAHEILKMVNGIKQESEKFNKTLDTLGNHVKNTYNLMGTVSQDYLKLKANIGTAASLQAKEANDITDKLPDKTNHSSLL